MTTPGIARIGQSIVDIVNMFGFQNIQICAQCATSTSPCCTTMKWPWQFLMWRDTRVSIPALASRNLAKLLAALYYKYLGSKANKTDTNTQHDHSSHARTQRFKKF